MRQFNFEYPAVEEALSGLADIRNILDGEQAAGRCADALLLVFLTGFMKEEAQVLLDALDRALPGVPRAGITEIASATADGNAHYVKLNLMTSAQFSFQIAQFPCRPGEEREAGLALSHLLEKSEYVRGIALFPSGVSLDITEFMKAATEGRDDLPVFGAMANGVAQAWFGEARKETVFCIGAELVECGFTVAVFAGKNLSVFMNYVLGWDPIGPEFSVKLAPRSPYGEGAAAEIDGKPAMNLYKKYLGVEWNEHFMRNVCEFPLMVRRNGTDICMIPLSESRGGTLYFSGPLYEGEKLRLSYGTKGCVLAASWRGARLMREFAPEATFLSLCANRINYFQDEAHVEWDRYREFAPNLTFCHGHGEIAYQGGRGGVLNSSIVAVGFREGPPPAGAVAGIPEDGEDFPFARDGVIPLSYRMSRFLWVMTKELERMTVKAEAANRAKSVFLSSMSHEIRTPINAVLGMDEMILRESGEKNILEYAENIRTAGSSLLGLINDILDFSKIEAGKMEIIPANYEPASLLNDLVNMISQRAKDKGLTFTVEASSDIPSALFGDELRLKQVVTNILTNAVKYTQEGKVTLRVGCECDGENAVLVFSVADTGIGIKKEDMPRLFSAFERIDEERNRSIEGTGLGMAITTQLLSKMDSRLEVQSEYGRGSTFSFKLRQKIVNPEPMGDFSSAFHRALAERKQYRESFRAPDARVLAVDDMPMNLAVFRGLLKQTGIRVDTAGSGAECLDKVTKATYDLIFLDHRMPDMDGVETFKRMAGLPGNQNRNTPIIALTANAVSGAKEEYRALGFAGYLSKPIDSAALEKLLRQSLPPEKVKTIPAGEEPPSEDKPLSDELPQVEGLDWAFAELHLPTRELLETALRDFYSVIASHADKLDGFYHALPNAWDDYRILVHGMKSSAATVGIIPLAGVAKMLEYAARDRDRATVEALHGSFLKEWRSYGEKLKGVFGLGVEDTAEAPKEFDREAVRELIKAVRDSAEEFDTDAADAAMERLKPFSFPPSLAEDFQKLQTALLDVDTDAVLRVADKMLRKMEDK